MLGGRDVQLNVLYLYLQEDGHTFTYPDLFKDGKPGDKETSEFEKSTKEIEQREVEQWDKQSIPPWFR